MEYKDFEIILIEDSLSDAEMTIRTLRKGNMVNKIVHLEDGFEGLEFLFNNSNTAVPKVILVDLKMPRLSGIEFLRKVKANDSTKSIPVVVLTSSEDNPELKKCDELGVKTYLVKPVKLEAFNKAMNALGISWSLVNQTSN